MMADPFEEVAAATDILSDYEFTDSRPLGVGTAGAVFRVRATGVN
jgi:hypothetical protein